MYIGLGRREDSMNGHLFQMFGVGGVDLIGLSKQILNSLAFNYLYLVPKNIHIKSKLRLKKIVI